MKKANENRLIRTMSDDATRVAVLVLLVASSVAIADDSACALGENCTISGEIVLFLTPPKFTSVLDTEAYCVPLALPKSVYAEHETWNKKRVVLRGRAFPNYKSDDAILTWDVLGRDVTASICDESPYIIYVEEISLAE